MCPLGPGCHERSRGRLLRSLGAHSFCPECLENASVRLDPTTDSPEEPDYMRIRNRQRRAYRYHQNTPTRVSLDKRTLRNKVQRERSSLGDTTAKTMS